MSEGSQLERLAQVLPAEMVKKNPSGYGTYVSHSVITQRLLDVVGPFNTRVIEVLRGEFEHKVKAGTGDLERVDMREGVVGCVLELSCAIDGKFITVAEAGDCESPDNWPHDGARLKDATSDALKRCAMRLGLGLWLWSQKDVYFLHDHLMRSGAASPPDGGTNGSEGAAPPIPETRKVNQ